MTRGRASDAARYGEDRLAAMHEAQARERLRAQTAQRNTHIFNNIDSHWSRRSKHAIPREVLHRALAHYRAEFVAGQDAHLTDDTPLHLVAGFTCLRTDPPEAVAAAAYAAVREAGYRYMRLMGEPQLTARSTRPTERSLNDDVKLLWL